MQIFYFKDKPREEKSDESPSPRNSWRLQSMTYIYKVYIYIIGIGRENSNVRMENEYSFMESNM